MREVNLPPLLVVSAYLGSLSPRENLNRTSELQDWLRSGGRDFTRAVGCYKGKEEASFIVASSPSDTELLRVLFEDFEQESVLVLRSDRSAFLLFSTGEEVELGFLKGVSREEAVRSPDWTLNGSNRTFYVVKEAL